MEYIKVLNKCFRYVIIIILLTGSKNIILMQITKSYFHYINILSYPYNLILFVTVYHQLTSMEEIEDADKHLNHVDILCRITGKQSVERLKKLIMIKYSQISRFHNVYPIDDNAMTNCFIIDCKCEKCIKNLNSISNISDYVILRSLSIPLVWETRCEKQYKSIHRKAQCLNKLHNSNIIENKANLIYLERIINNKYKEASQTLEAYYFSGIIELNAWLEIRWSNTKDPLPNDWWVLKAAKGNGGKDIYIISYQNFKAILTNLNESTDEYIIQR